MLLAISFYEALTTHKYRAKDGVIKTFNFEDYITRCHDVYKLRRLRMFADLNYFFYNGAAHFRSDWAQLPYPHTPTGFAFDGPLNPAFQARVDFMGKAGTKAPTIEFLICYMTQGPDYGSPFFLKMGYPESKLYYDRAEDPAKPLPWAKLQKYCKQLHELFQVKPVRFKYYELYNERGWGSLVDEFKGLRAPGSVRLMNLNADRIEKLMTEPDWDPDGFTRWVARLKSGALGFKISRFAFHGVFTPEDVRSIATLGKRHGMLPKEIEVYTDGATPWREANGKYRFTYESHQGHYLARSTWDASLANQNCVIGAAKAIVAEATKQGVAVCDLQSPLKWQEDLVFRTSTERYYQEVTTA